MEDVLAEMVEVILLEHYRTALGVFAQELLNHHQGSVGTIERLTLAIRRSRVNSCCFEIL